MLIKETMIKNYKIMPKVRTSNRTLSFVVTHIWPKRSIIEKKISGTITPAAGPAAKRLHM